MQWNTNSSGEIVTLSNFSGRWLQMTGGGYYIPDYNSFTSYAKRIVYRAGLRYEKTGLVIQNQEIDEDNMDQLDQK